MTTTEPKKFKRLERRKLKRMLCGKRPYNTLAERQELTDMVAIFQRKKKQENRRCYCVDESGRIRDSGRYGVFDDAVLEAIRDCYFSGGPDSALLKYQEILLQFEDDIRRKQQELGNIINCPVLSMDVI